MSSASIPAFTSFRAASGGYGARGIDLFCTVSAVEGYRALSRSAGCHTARTVRAVRALGSGIGALGSNRGQPPDAWSTAYGTLTLTALGQPIPAGWINFLTSLAGHDGGFAMSPGNAAEIWASGLALQALAQAGALNDVDLHSVARWFASCQTPAGGLTWSPDAAGQTSGDVRATAFALTALQSASAMRLFASEADVDLLAHWLRSLQDNSGGFRLDEHHRPCLWGTGEALAALQVLGARPHNPRSCRRFVEEHIDLQAGGFVRATMFPQRSDVWANRQGIRSLGLLGASVPGQLADSVTAFLDRCALSAGGYTYRPVEDAPDALTTAAAVLAGDNSPSTLDVLAASVMPDEGGYAYMPARGAEARATQWTVTALRASGRAFDVGGLARWAGRMQNPDGGFGAWIGRGSDDTSTCAVVHTVGGQLQIGLDFAALRHRTAVRLADVLAGATTDVVKLSVLCRTAVALSMSIDGHRVMHILDAHGIDGGWRRSERSAPDLATTYAVLLAHQALGRLGDRVAAAARWTNRLARGEDGVAWSALARVPAGPVPSALASLISATAEDPCCQLPDLCL